MTPRTDGLGSVAVVIPTVGRPSLVTALASVRRQTRPPTEVFVVLDNPERRDQVEGVIGDGETLVVTNGAEGGAVARNLGLQSAQTDYVAYLDDDDWWEPLKVEAQTRFMAEAEPTASFTGVHFHRRDGRITKLPITEPPVASTMASYMVHRPRLRYGTSFVQSSTLMVDRRKAVATSWDSSLRKHQDWDYVARLDVQGEGRGVRYLPSALTHVQQGSPGSISKVNDWRASAQWLARHRNELDFRAKGDFILCHVARGAISSRDWAGVRFALSELRTSRPHLASVMVALTALQKPRTG